jgi:cysteine desulfurase
MPINLGEPETSAKVRAGGSTPPIRGRKRVHPIYLDHAATTAVRPEVIEAMLPYFSEAFGNASSSHRWGRQARNALEQARERVAASLGGKRREVVFTGGGTEADNIAVLGRWRTSCREGRGGAIVCSAVEHKAVGAAAHEAGIDGADVILLAVDESGRVDLGSLDEALGTGPCVVSVMWGNNEVGTLQPVAEIAERCRARGISFHTDAVQAFGKVRVRVDEVACDLLSLSGHKLAGPKGVGALYVREGVTVLPLTHGGGQERQLRPGTENVAAAVGLAVAAELSAAEQEDEAKRLGALRDRLEAGLRERIPELIVNGAGAERLPHVLNVTVPGADQEGFLIGLDLEGVAASGASACQSGSVSPSHVLTAMGRLEPESASVRLSLGLTTTDDEIDRALEVLPRVVERVRVTAGT